jgi:DNA gyrase subunit A
MMQRALGDEAFADLSVNGGPPTAYTPDGRAGGCDSPHDARAVGQSRTGKADGRSSAAARGDRGGRRICPVTRTFWRSSSSDLRRNPTPFRQDRRTEISGEEIGNIDMEDLITEETMVVSISHRGYIKRTPASVYRAQRRGGKGLKGAKTDDEDPIEHLFVASTHAYLLFFTNQGKVYWQKVYELAATGTRESRTGDRQSAEPGAGGADRRLWRCATSIAGHFLMMATRKGLVKKTPLEAYSRPKRGGIIAIKLREDDELVDVVVTKPGDEVVLATASGMAIRFRESMPAHGTQHVRVSRASRSARATNWSAWWSRTRSHAADGLRERLRQTHAVRGRIGRRRRPRRTTLRPPAIARSIAAAKACATSRRPERNGRVIGITRVSDDDEVLMMTARGKIQRVAAREISVIGRNTQGVRIMTLDEDDVLAAIVRVPQEERGGSRESRGRRASSGASGLLPPLDGIRRRYSFPDLHFGEGVRVTKRALITGITGQDGAYLAEFCSNAVTRFTAWCAGRVPRTSSGSGTCATACNCTRPICWISFRSCD